MSDQTTEEETPTAAEEGAQEVSTPEDQKGVDTADTLEDEPDTFPREYVQKLRDENAKYRQKAADRDTLAQQLHTALVTATGRLADPSDLAYDENHLTDPDALTAAIEQLVSRKPHLAARRIVGDVGQGATNADTTVDLAGLLRRNAS